MVVLGILFASIIGIILLSMTEDPKPTIKAEVKKEVKKEIIPEPVIEPVIEPKSLNLKSLNLKLRQIPLNWNLHQKQLERYPK